MDELSVCWLGCVEYREALALQEQVWAARQRGFISDTLLLLEHPAVITRGRRAGADDLALGESWYREQGIDVVDVNRGGKLTLHNPGQLVGYPIVGVTDVVDYIRRLEQALVAALAETQIIARARPEDGSDFTGVWVGESKIASIGVHVARGVTTHGFALNVTNDMTPWGWFTACGLPSVTMTSVAGELGIETSGAGDLLGCVRKRTAHAVARALARRQRLITPTALSRTLKSLPSIAAQTPRPDPAQVRLISKR